MKLAYLTSHPIQYQAPLLRALSARPGVDLTVLYCHDHGMRPTHDPGFGRVIQYDVPLTEGLKHRFLRNVSPKPRPGFAGLINPGVVVEVASGRFDAVISHGYMSISNLLAWSVPRAVRTKLLLRGDNNLLEPRSPRKLAIKKPLLPRVFGRYDHFLAVGSMNRDYYLHYGVPPERVTIAPYAVDNDYFAARANERSPAQHRARLGLPGDRPLFLFCAKLISVKRPLDLIEAFARARAQAPCGLVFAGDGELSSPARERARSLGVADDVFFLGFQNQSELPGVYAACDALVLPSDREPWGLVLNEAMACGLAVGASNTVGAAGDLVRDNGFIYPVGNVDALAHGLTAWATQPSLLEQHKAASVRIINAWGLQQSVDGMLEGVGRCLSGATSQPAEAR